MPRDNQRQGVVGYPVAWFLLMLIGLGSLAGCETAEDVDEKVIASYREVRMGGALFEVIQEDELTCEIRLRVTRDGETITRTMTRFFPVSVAGILTYEQWILVLNNHYVVGGYNIETDEFVGRGSWEHLPFTIWAGSGKIVAEGYYLPSLTGVEPQDFPHIPDPLLRGKLHTATQPAAGEERGDPPGSN